MKEKEFLPWVNDFIKTSSRNRMEIANDALKYLENFKSSKQDTLGLETSHFLKNKKLNELIGVIPNLKFIKCRGNSKDLSSTQVNSWCFPRLVYKQKQLPILIVVGPEDKIEYVTSEEKENNYKVKECLSWFSSFKKASPIQREAIVKSILDGVKSFNSKEGKATPEGVEVAESLSNKRQNELVGVTPNLMYLRCEGSKDQLNAIWVHPWGSPKLVYKHKKLPILLIAGPDLRFNESIIQEVEKNRYSEEIFGVTG